MNEQAPKPVSDEAKAIVKEALQYLMMHDKHHDPYPFLHEMIDRHLAPLMAERDALRAKLAQAPSPTSRVRGV